MISSAAEAVLTFPATSTITTVKDFVPSVPRLVIAVESPINVYKVSAAPTAIVTGVARSTPPKYRWAVPS